MIAAAPEPPAPAAQATFDDTFVELTVNGQVVHVEAFEAMEVLGRLDRRHEHDANECQACGRFSGPGETCPACGSADLRASQVYRDDLVASLRGLGVPPCSGRTALAICRTLAEVADSKKNASSTTPASPSGTASTPTT